VGAANGAESAKTPSNLAAFVPELQIKGCCAYIVDCQRDSINAR
jgi:hypothetical protein